MSFQFRNGPFFVEQGRTRVYGEAYSTYVAAGKPRRTPLGGKRAIYGWKLEPISKIRSEFRARRGTVKKRSIHVVCEHFEPFHNAAMGT
jgi:hypothetical protein